MKTKLERELEDLADRIAALEVAVHTQALVIVRLMQMEGPRHKVWRNIGRRNLLQDRTEQSRDPRLGAGRWMP